RDGVAGGVRHGRGGPAAGRADRRPVELVRPAVAATVLVWSRRPGRRGGVRDAARGARRAHEADGADHAIPRRLRVGRAAARRRGGTGAPVVVAVVRRRADRRFTVFADGARPAAGRAGPVGAVGRRGAHQAAAVPGAGRGFRVRCFACRAAGTGG